MNYPELLFIPGMSILYHWLVLWGRHKREGEYAKHYKTKVSEINPLWRNEIDQKKILPRKLIISTTVLLLAMMLLDWAASGVSFGPSAVTLLFGFWLGFLTSSATLVLRGLCFMYYVDKNHDSIKGTVSLSHSYITFASTIELASMALLLGVAAFVSPSLLSKSIFAGAITAGLRMFYFHMTQKNLDNSSS